MFPESEIARIDEPSADIVGLTAIDRVFGRLCDWVEPGSIATVFPAHASSPMEPGIDLGPLLG
jgi:hypothetical protein